VEQGARHTLLARILKQIAASADRDHGSCHVVSRVSLAGEANPQHYYFLSNPRLASPLPIILYLPRKQ
jgi:hypothetical protein